jgi:hypothetical protein
MSERLPAIALREGRRLYVRNDFRLNGADKQFDSCLKGPRVDKREPALLA